MAVWAALAALVLLGALWLGQARKLPVALPPSGPAPSPNAYNGYIRAAAGIVGSKAVRNASEKPGTPIARKKAFLAANDAVLKAFRKASAYGYLCPLDAKLSDQLKFRDLGSLLRLEGQVRAARGDYSGAMDSLLDAMRLGEDLPNGAPLITRMLANDVENTGRLDAWDLIDKLNASEARAAARKMEAIRGRHIPLSQVMRNMKWFIVDDARSGALDGMLAINSHFPELIRSVYLKQSTKESFRVLDAYAATVKQPYPIWAVPYPRAHSDLARMVRASCDTVWFGDSCSRAENALLQLALALRAYSLEYGAYPARLADLSPSYVRTIPSDPFTKSSPFNYRRTSNDYLLYSVGPDGADDGGRPTGLPVGKNTAGDIVAWVDVEMETE